MIVPPKSIWQNSARALLVGVILHALYQAKHSGKAAPSLFYIDAMLSDLDRDVAELWMETSPRPPRISRQGGSEPRIVAATARDMMDRGA